MGAAAARRGPSSSLRETARGHCPHCLTELQMHQPDRDLPNRLLAVCEACHSWYLMDNEGTLSLLLKSGEKLTGH
jgi:hypothetical protein